MIHVLKCFINVLKKEFKNHYVYIDKSTDFKRPSFYISIQQNMQPLNMFYKLNTYYVTIRYFGPLLDKNVGDKLAAYEMVETFNSAVKNKIPYQDSYMRIIDRNIFEDAMGDLIIELVVESEDFENVYDDVNSLIKVNNININEI